MSVYASGMADDKDDVKHCGATCTFLLKRDQTFWLKRHQSLQHLSDVGAQPQPISSRCVQKESDYCFFSPGKLPHIYRAATRLLLRCSKRARFVLPDNPSIEPFLLGRCRCKTHNWRNLELNLFLKRILCFDSFNTLSVVN